MRGIEVYGRRLEWLIRFFFVPGIGIRGSRLTRFLAERVPCHQRYEWQTPQTSHSAIASGHEVTEDSTREKASAGTDPSRAYTGKPEYAPGVSTESPAMRPPRPIIHSHRTHSRR